MVPPGTLEETSISVQAPVEFISPALVNQTHSDSTLSRFTRQVRSQLAVGMLLIPVKGKTTLPVLDVGACRPVAVKIRRTARIRRPVKIYPITPRSNCYAGLNFALHRNQETGG